jgi:hypothetical protein
MEGICAHKCPCGRRLAAEAGIKHDRTSSQSYIINELAVTQDGVANALSDAILPMVHDYLCLRVVEFFLGRCCQCTGRGWP